MTDQPQTRTILPHEPTITECGCVTIPLGSAEWDLVLEHGGGLSLLCNVPNLQGGVTRNTIYLGEMDLDPVDLLEFINLARTNGATKLSPN